MVLDETIHEKNYWTSSKACASLVIVDFYGHKSHSGSFFWGMSIFSGFVKQLALFCNVLFINLTSVRPTQENTHTHTHTHIIVFVVVVIVGFYKLRSVEFMLSRGIGAARRMLE